MNNDKSYRKVFWTLVLVGLTLDLASKYVVFTWLYNQGRGGEHVVVNGVFEILAQYTGEVDDGTHVFTKLRTVSGPIQPRVNHGALFGLAGKNGMLANAIFASISLAAALAILYWSGLPAARQDLALSIALGLILAGTLGNLFDRLVFHGVRDFIHWHYHDLFDWPVFNIADCCLVVGAGLLLSQALFTRTLEDPGSKPELAGAAATIDH